MRASGRSAAQPCSKVRVDGGAPAGAEALGQGALERRPGLQPAPGDDGEPGVIKTASPTVAQPPSESMSPCPNARRGPDEQPVEPGDRHLVEEEPRRKLRVRPGERNGARANSVPTATRATVTR